MPMRQRSLLIIFYSAVILLSGACSKGGNAVDDHSGGGGGNPSPNDVTPPILDIYTPTANQVFTSGNNIDISGRIADDLGLYRGSIRITNDATGQVVKEQLYEIHYVLLYSFNISYTTSVTVPTDYTVTVFFEDHGYNSATKSVKVKVNP